MRTALTILAAVTGLSGLSSAGQVNFYYDTGCHNFAGSTYPGSYQITGCASMNPPIPSLLLYANHHPQWPRRITLRPVGLP